MIQSPVFGFFGQKPDPKPCLTDDKDAGGGETEGGAGEVGGGDLPHIAHHADPLQQRIQIHLFLKSV